MLSTDQVRQLYNKRAKTYDRLVNFLDYFEGRGKFLSYTKMAIEQLGLRDDATVLEIGCGTGFNFPLLQEKLGPKGKLIGIDLSENMLAEARKRVQKEGWSNVELVHTDAAVFEFPENLDAIFSCFAITLIPEYRDVIRRGADALASGGRFVILDLRAPENWPTWRTRLALLMYSPFGASLAYAGKRQPWEAIDEYLAKVSFTELYGGLVYISCGEKP
jgi:ubiquinone/menaquinone biosynthesis C-methylase UbiE